jgi:hypothetical protein
MLGVLIRNLREIDRGDDYPVPPHPAFVVAGWLLMVAGFLVAFTILMAMLEVSF